MLHARPVSLFSWDYRVVDGTLPVARIERSRFREPGHLLLEEAAYAIRREKLLGGRFLLLRDGIVVASAEKPRAVRRRFLIVWDDARFVLEPASWLSRRFVLYHDGDPIGTIRPARRLSRHALVDLPDTLPLALRLFVLWLVLLLWKRSVDHAAG